MKNIKFMRTVSRACLLLFILAMFLLFVSCGATKHKETKKEETKIELSENDKSKNENSKDTISKKEVDHNKELTSKTKAVVYEGKKGDSLIVTEENLVTGEKKKTTYHGSGKLSETTKDEASKENIKSSEENTGKSISKSENENNSKFKASGSSSETIKDKKTSYCWLWLIILLIVAALVWYLNKRFKWLFWLSNYVTGIFNS